MTDEKMDGKKKNKKKTAECCGYPVSIFFIVVNEFCERFSYYGMRAVLVLYFRYFLRWDDDLATSIYHAFVALCYLTPILGAIIADSWLGKFKTIIYLSIVYAIGQVIMAVSTVHDITDTNRDGTPDNLTFHVALSMLGLVLIALGTGGIKPCVSAFGGDQFQEHQSQQLNTFFSVFYLCINAGSLLSTLITPVLRAQDCGIYSQQKCYPLAFGVPAALMVVSLVVFIAGSGMYVKTAPEGNIMSSVCKCIGFAIKNRFRHRSSRYPKREHWMDWADEKYDKLLIAQIKMVLKVLFLYIPLPMFWTLFDQKGSRWTLQATTMTGDFGAFILQPDQMQTVNPILILTLVPIMDRIIFPLIEKCGLNFRKLLIAQIKMVLKVLFLYIPLPMFWTLFDQKGSRWTLQATTMTGDFGAFILQPDQMQTVNPILILTLVPIMDRIIFPLIEKCGLNFSPLKRMTVGMLFAAMAFIAAALVQIEIDKTLPNFPSSSESQLKVVNMGSRSLTVTITNTEPLHIPPLETSGDYLRFDVESITVSVNTDPVISKALSLMKSQRHTLIISSDPTLMYLTEDRMSKPEEGKNAVRFVNDLTEVMNITDLGSVEPTAVSNYTLVSQGPKKFVLSSGQKNCTFSPTLGFGSSLTFLIPRDLSWTECNSLIRTVEDIKPNSVHMALQIPQYFLITTGEVMFSVTGLQFSYSQAPKNMKSVLQAGWLCTNAVGNIIVLIVAELGKLPKQWAEYVLFASLLVAVSIIFSIMAYFYKYMDPAEIEAQIKRELEPEDKEKETQQHELKQTKI